MFTEKQVVEFGNYLLRRYDVQEYSTDGKNIPLSQRQVSDADFQNWKHEKPDKDTWLPSQFNIGDIVIFSVNQSFGEIPYPYKANVIAVHFYEGKVKYDLSIPIYNEPPTRIYNIDSCFVLPLKEEQAPS
jgi:hypothetical protein